MSDDDTARLAGDPLSELCRRLEELAEISDELRAAIERDDAGRVRELAERTQALSASVAAANQATLTIDPATAPAEVAQRIESASIRVRAGSDALGAWLARTAGESAPAKAEKPAGKGLASLPKGWDFEVDVALVVGGTGTLASELAAAGQERLLVYLPEDCDAELPERAIAVRSHAELSEAILLLPGRTPKHGVALRAAGTDTALFEQVGKTLRETLESMATNRNTVELFGESWLLQGAANLPAVASWPSIDALTGAFEGKPCVIVSPGPSLDKNVHLLPSIKDRALVVTSSHALHALWRAGVVPDLVLAVDPQDLRYHFDGCSADEIGALLLGVTVHPELYRSPSRRIFSFAGNSVLDQWIYDCLGDEARMPVGGSVACSALTFALRAKCDPIILVGQDLAFAGDRYYSQLSIDASLRVSATAGAGTFTLTGLGDALARSAAARPASHATMRMTEAPGYHGGTVPTSFIFQLFRRFMEMIARSEAGRTRLVNCTEGGARIEGFEQLPLATAIERWMHDPIGVEHVLDRALSRTDREERRGKMRERIRELIAALDQCVDLARDCSRYARQARRNPNRLRPLREAEARLKAALQPVLFVSLLAQVRIQVAHERGLKAKDLETNLDASLELFAVVERAGGVLRPILAKALGELS